MSDILEYNRVVPDIQPGVAISAPAVNDAVHLLAEIIEHATALAPVDDHVNVNGPIPDGGGILIEVTDSGVGIPAERLEQLNARLDNPPAADVSVSRHMGLFAVSHLAARHGVRVRLRPGSPRGLTALVWLPDTITDRDEAAPGGWPANAYAHLPGPAPQEASVPPDRVVRVGGYYLPAGGRRHGAHERVTAPSGAAAPPVIPGAVIP